MPDTATTRTYDNFASYYAAYLGEHGNRWNRRLHLVGSAFALICLACFIGTRDGLWLAAAIGCRYAFAWNGHHFHERNQVAWLRQPVYGFRAHWTMMWEMLTGKIPF